MNYESQAKKVWKQIRAKGARITIIRDGDATGWTKQFDVQTREYFWVNDGDGSIETTDPAVPGSFPGYALVEPASAGAIQAFDIRIEGGTMIETNLRSLMIAAYDLEIIPHPGDRVEFGGERWQLLGNTPLVLDAKTYIYHKCTAKRGGV